MYVVFDGKLSHQTPTQETPGKIGGRTGVGCSGKKQKAKIIAARTEAITTPGQHAF